MGANQDIRNLIAEKRLRKWEVAKQVGISDGRFSVWLRVEMPEERKKRVLNAISQLTEATGGD